MWLHYRINGFTIVGFFIFNIVEIVEAFLKVGFEISSRIVNGASLSIFCLFRIT